MQAQDKITMQRALIVLTSPHVHKQCLQLVVKESSTLYPKLAYFSIELTHFCLLSHHNGWTAFSCDRMSAKGKEEWIKYC